MLRWVMLSFLVTLLATVAQAMDVVRIGSKNFTEGYVIAEFLAQKIEAAGIAKVERKFGLGGTGIVYTALLNDEIDIYPEYTGTLSTAILQASAEMSEEEIADRLKSQGLGMSRSLGFDNSYGLAVRRDFAEKNQIKNISDLQRIPNLRMAFSYEFMERADGFKALMGHYKIRPQLKDVRRMDHALVYEAIEEKKVDVIEVYTTDAKIEKLDLLVLNDDRRFFPKYNGVFIFSTRLAQRAPKVRQLIEEMPISLSNAEVQKLHGAVELRNLSFAEAVREYNSGQQLKSRTSFWAPIRQHTRRHLVLVFFPIFAAILVGVPLGILAAKIRYFGQAILVVSGLLQTVPSLALLCFLIPLFGIGLVPSLIALFLYSLLPIVRSAHSGIVSVDHRYTEVAHALGLTKMQTLLRVEMPLSSVAILGGIKTATIINVGMATLAAFVGAGGYGAMIVTGLALNNNQMILQGALPAALMAIAAHYVFEYVDRWLVPKGLR